MKQILIIGGIIGAVNILIGLIVKFGFGIETMLSTAYLGFSFVFAIVLLIVLGRKFLRTDEFPSLNYGEALKYLVPAGLLGYLLSILFTTVLYQNDAQMKKAFTEYTVNVAQTSLEWGLKVGGADEATIALEKEKAAKQTRADADKNYPFQFSKIPFNILNGLIGSLFNGLIASIFVRYKNTSA